MYQNQQNSNANTSSNNSGNSSSVVVPEAKQALNNMKYEIARELGLMDKVRQVGWAGLSAKETGRIGGLMSRKHHTSKGD